MKMREILKSPLIPGRGKDCVKKACSLIIQQGLLPGALRLPKTGILNSLMCIIFVFVLGLPDDVYGLLLALHFGITASGD